MNTIPGNGGPKPRFTAALVFLSASALARPATAQDSAVQFENLRVLPHDISDDDLGEIMLDNLRGLGLRRLAGEGCLFCHVGDLERPRDTWDYASDAKLTKRKARVMMAMVREINQEHLPQLTRRIDAEYQVTCYSCHAGRTDPRPLPTILLESYDAGGIDSVARRYRALRARYFGADAYDFRPAVLAGIASELADRGAIDDAVTLAALNREANPDLSSATRSWLHYVLLQTIDSTGVESALAMLDRMAPDLESTVFTPAILDGLGWRLMRRDRQPEAIALLEANLARFPNRYVPNESMAFVLRTAGRLDEAIAVLETWIEIHPDHDRARRLLVNMRG